VSFRFRLQRVLELREKSEQARAQTLHAATQNADEQRRQQDAMRSLRQLQRDSLEAASHGVITAGELQHLAFIIDQLDDRLVRASDDVLEAERLVAEAHAALQLASRDRRVIGRLKERHVERWQDAEQMRDRNDMDEIALSRFTRKRMSGDAAGPEQMSGNGNTPSSTRSTTPPASPAI
jgi:flagellar FliJ protein